MDLEIVNCELCIVARERRNNLDTKYIKMAMEYRNLIDVLMSDKEFADIVLYNGEVINVITREVYKADIAIKGEYIVLVGGL